MKTMKAAVVQPKNSKSHELGLVQHIPAAVQFTAQIMGLFSGGNSGKKRRSQKRGALKQAGFNWMRSDELPTNRGWNIGSWDDAALDNIFAATQKYGEIVIELHNDRKLDKSLAQNRQQLFQFIEQNMPNPTIPAVAGVGSMFSNPVALGVGSLVLAGGAYAAIKSMK